PSASLSGTPEGAIKLAEGRGFEPPRDSRPYPISSRTPSTGLGHPSAKRYQHVAAPRYRGPVYRSRAGARGKSAGAGLPSVPSRRRVRACAVAKHGGKHPGLVDLLEQPETREL